MAKPFVENLPSTNLVRYTTVALMLYNKHCEPKDSKTVYDTQTLIIENTSLLYNLKFELKVIPYYMSVTCVPIFCYTIRKSELSHSSFNCH